MSDKPGADKAGPDKAGADEPEVLVERRGRLGLLTLNRPRAINALTLDMVRRIVEALDGWRDDPDVATVAIVGSGERGLCAGGDVVGLYRDVTQGDGRGAATFWREEFVMNAMISSYPKPYVAIQDGIVLGGGVGVSAHGSHRVVTERTRSGFPETTIGYVPDVGASWLLSQAPGQLGTRLALSSENIGAADAILVGFSDRFVPGDRIPQLLTALESTDADAALDRFVAEPPAGILAGQRDWTDEAFSAPTIGAILARLRRSGIADADELADRIDAKSPIALAVALEAIRRAGALPDLESALRQEYRVSRHSSTTHDFAEGIRAQLIDKDRNPHWQPDSHRAAEGEVEAFFAEPADGDLQLAAAVSKERT